jgi:hypothetical protein
VVTQSGKYKPKTIDYPENDAKRANQIRTVVYNKPGESMDRFDTQFKATLARINAGNFKYYWGGPNSNTVARHLLADAGLPTNVVPFGINPAGWDYDFWRDELPRYDRRTDIPYSNLGSALDNNLNPYKYLKPSQMPFGM